MKIPEDLGCYRALRLLGSLNGHNKKDLYSSLETINIRTEERRKLPKRKGVYFVESHFVVRVTCLA